MQYTACVIYTFGCHTTRSCELRGLCLPTIFKHCAPMLTADLSYRWLYPSKQAIDRFMLFAHLDCVPLLSRLKCLVEQVLTADLSACTVGAGRLLIARSMNNITGPTDARTEPGSKLQVCIVY